MKQDVGGAQAYDNAVNIKRAWIRHTVNLDNHNSLHRCTWIEYSLPGVMRTWWSQ